MNTRRIVITYDTERKMWVVNVYREGDVFPYHTEDESLSTLCNWIMETCASSSSSS